MPEGKSAPTETGLAPQPILISTGERTGDEPGRPGGSGLSVRDRLRTLPIGVRLAAVVLMTGCLTFGVIGVLTSLRLDFGLREQAAALGVLSERQLGQKLEAEAKLARARLDMLFAEADRQVLALSRRADVVQTVQTGNDITIRELFAPAARTADIDVLLAVAPDGFVTGANAAVDLLEVNDSVRTSDLGAEIRRILKSATRRDRGAFNETRRLGGSLGPALGIDRGRIGRVAIEPVFDDFGDVSGALVGIRLLAPVEPTFERFAELAQVSVMVLTASGPMSRAGGSSIELAYQPQPQAGLLFTADRTHVAQCADYVAASLVCAFTGAAEIKASQDQMFRIGARLSRSLMSWFLVLAAISLVALVAALLISVRHATRGLPQLSRAAASVAQGELDVPFTATGVGEVRSLGVAFEAMLSNLQGSLGQIRQLAYYDQVTGLANREKIRLDASARLKSLAAAGSAALVFIDLNRFKSINDTFGHKIGDQLLSIVADRLKAFFREKEEARLIGEALLARLGGDEFLAVVSREGESLRLDDLLDELLDALREPYDIGPARMLVGGSVGVAVLGIHGRDYETLLMNADIAMYVAKRRGGTSCVMFTADAAEMMQERLAIENDLKIAVRERRLEVHYQPKVSCADGSIVGVEALARWQHPSRDYIPPSKFIMIAEEAGLVPDIGLFVLERAIEDFTSVLAGGPPISLAVNVSVIQLEDLNFASAVQSILRRTGFRPTLLELEITESMATRDSEVVQQQIASLRALGIRIAIDDFGTGYSNLATLARLPIDTIKLDRSLVQDLPASAEKQTIVRTIFGLARSFGFKTVAEGVETPAELGFLVQEGADIAQGYLFSPAVPISTLVLLLQPSGLRSLMRDPQTRAMLAQPVKARSEGA